MGLVERRCLQWAAGKSQKGEQHVLVIFQPRTRFGVFGFIEGQEVLVSAQGILSGG